MKKVVFNATILNDRPTGLGVYCKNILSRIDKDLNSYILYTNNFKNEEEDKKEIILKTKSDNKIKSIILRNYELKKWIKRNKNKNIVYYSPTQHGVSVKGIKQIVTIHDLMPLYFPKGRAHQYIYYKYNLKRIIANSEVIITCSNNTKKDLINEYKIDEKKIKVIYNGFDVPKAGVNKEQSKKYVKEKYNIEDYIFMMGIHYSYKNLHSVIEAYDLLRNKITNDIVIAGGNNNNYGQELVKLVREKGLENRIKFLGYVPDDDKDKLYQGARMFVYPSKYQGFGLPVLEAMANHVPVACSNTASLPEVVGDAAFSFNPDSIDEIKNMLIKVLSLNNNEYEEYINKGLEQIKKFSWDKCAKEVEKVITNVAMQEE